LKNTKRPHLRAVVAVVAAIFAIAGLAIAAAMPASAESKTASATGFAAHATAYQNAVLGDAMAAHPGGVRISASQVKWPDGTIAGAAVAPSVAGAATVHPDATPPSSACESVHFCGYTDYNWTGNYSWVGSDYGFWPFGECSPQRYAGCDSGTLSWDNQSGVRVWLEQYQNSGNELCIDPASAGNWQDSKYTGPDQNDYWWLLSSNKADC
jgi:hypothetical protein